MISFSMMAEEKKQTDTKANPAPTQTDSGKESDKLDLKQLEDKYWAAKDTDFTVVQNRTYAKDKRYFFSMNYGPLVNDAYSIGRQVNFAGGYYFSERWGVELANESGNLVDNSATMALGGSNGLKPNYNKYVNYTSVNALWVPMYAKMSVLDRAIWYFDLQLGLGLGSMTYQNQIDSAEGGNTNKTAIGINFDATANIFFHQHWAFRIDIKNKFTNQNLQHFRLPVGSSVRDMGDQGQQDTSFLLGFTYFH
jgi:outer membrane beta-barrel protein